jgi:hypothetical protein
LTAVTGFNTWFEALARNASLLAADMAVRLRLRPLSLIWIH